MNRKFVGVQINGKLAKDVDVLIADLGTYNSRAEFCNEAVRVRLESVKKAKQTGA